MQVRIKRNLKWQRYSPTTSLIKAALGIGGDHENNFTEEDHSDHSSVKTIRKTHKESNFEFKFFTMAEVEQALNPKKSS